jgi:hypothetical protein
MATNLNVAAQIYSKRFLAGLTPQLSFLSAFSTDFSDELSEPGETINVPLVKPDAAAAFDATSNNFARAVADLEDVPIKIDKSGIAGFAITLAQIMTFNKNWWEAKADQNLMSVAQKIQTDVYAVITEANFTKTPIAVALAGFTKKVVAAIAGKAADAGLTVERSALCLAPNFFYALLGELDATVYGGAEAIRNGVIPALYGFGKIVRASGYAGAGYVCQADAIGVGGRKVMPLDTTPYKEFGSIIEPNTNMPINRVIYTNGAGGTTSFSASAWYGCDAANKDALVLLKA